jgi:hypothetical protein
MTMYPYALVLFCLFMSGIAYLLLNSNKKVGKKAEDKYLDMFDMDYQGGFEQLFEFYPRSKMQQLKKLIDDEE